MSCKFRVDGERAVLSGAVNGWRVELWPGLTGQRAVSSGSVKGWRVELWPGQLAVSSSFVDGWRVELRPFLAGRHSPYQARGREWHLWE
jgi:hypothetical protein